MTARVNAQALLPSTNYAVEVRAVRDGQTSEWSERFLFTTIAATATPNPPTSVTWLPVDDTFVATWTPVTLDTNGDPVSIGAYELELVAGVTTKNIVVPAKSGSDNIYTLTFSDNIGIFGTAQGSITMRMRAVDLNGLKSVYTTGITATNPVPAAVSGFTATGGLNVVDMTWTANTENDIDRYEIYAGTTSGFTPSGANRIFSGKVTRFTYTTTTYSLQWFKIAAFDKFNQPSATYASASATPTSPFGGDSTAPATPTGLAATITTLVSASLATSALVSWTANVETDLAGYTLQFRQAGTTPWSTVSVDKTATSTTINNLVPYVNYEFRIAAFDFSANQSAFSSTATGTGATNANPSTPTAPSVSTSTLQAQVTVPGTKAAGGAMEADVNYYEVYASTTTGFTPATTNMLGTIAVGPAMIATFDIPATGGASTQTWFFKIIAVDNGGLKSAASAQTSGTPSLIQATNITDATITNAKIADLAVDKLTAGTGLATSFTVKSTLTIGDASTTGAIQSFDYSAGTAGFRMASVAGAASLEINAGSISAAALKIQSGVNIAPPEFADFESNSVFYTANTALTAGTIVMDTTDKLFNSQSIKWTTSSATNSLDFSASTTTDNMIVNPSTTYIVSAYILNKTGGVSATGLNVGIRHAGTGGRLTVNGAAAVTATANNAWTRYSWTVTIGSTATGPAHLFILDTASGTVLWIDGIQIEEKMGSLTTPSGWKPPGSTSIDGYRIRTGSIVSTATTVVNGNTIPVWSIPLSGSASFANLQVRGNAVIGVAADTDGGASQIASGNYVAGAQGWVIRSDGYSEFRSMAANSITGDAIKADSLSVDKLTSGSLDNQIILADGSDLIATGEMGETVGLGDYGFLVKGPNQNTVTFKESGATTRTLTTSVPHNFAVGQKIRVIIGDTNYDTADGTFDTVATAPTTTTFTYVNSTSLSQASTAVANGIVQGLNTDLAQSSPLYISFPTDGTQPNIISGELTADNVTITEGMSIRKSSNIEQGASLTINSVIQPPHAGPSLTQSYITLTLDERREILFDVVKGHNGNYFTLSGFAGEYYVKEYGSAGILIAQRLAITTFSDRDAVSLVYANIAGGMYYLHFGANGGTGNQFDQHRVEVFNTSFVSQGTFTLGTSVSTSAPAFYGAKLGWDYTNNRMMFAWASGGLGGSTATIRYYTTSTITGLPTAQAGSDLVLSTTTYGIGFVARGDFDYGASSDNIVIKDYLYHTQTNLGSNFTVFTNTGVAALSKGWPVGDQSYMAGGFWDTITSKFFSINNGWTLRQYEGGDSYWATTTMKDTRWIAYSWYKSTSTAAESTCGPASNISFNKRSKITVTIAPIPLGGSNTPDQARVYMLDNPTNTFPTNYFLRATVMYPSTTITIDPASSAGATPHLTNDFTIVSGAPGQIVSATGNSFWKGDDTAQFYQLVLNSSTDVANTAGNKPALRIGNIAGTHLRIDGNEIMQMTGDTGQGTLLLNAGNDTTVYNLSINNHMLGAIDMNGNNIIGINNLTAPSNILMNPASGQVKISGASNVGGRIGQDPATPGTGSAVILKSSSITMGQDNYNNVTPTAGSTVTLHANDIHSWNNGILMEDLAGGGSTGANIGNGGRVVRTSSITMKDSVKDMTDKEAYSVLGLKSYTFKFKQDSIQSPDDPRRYPGFIAEQGAEAGAELWVGRQHKVETDEEGNRTITRDKNGPIIYFRTADVTVAHNHILKGHHSRIDELEAQVKTLLAEVEALRS